MTGVTCSLALTLTTVVTDHTLFIGFSISDTLVATRHISFGFSVTQAFLITIFKQYLPQLSFILPHFSDRPYQILANSPQMLMSHEPKRQRKGPRIVLGQRHWEPAELQSVPSGACFE
uniref:Uncharacterized protein n=1 Tax=Sphaerodactylus townsendi TaxID=933632 RepID=A0ACB8F7B6_9SAUR